MRMRKGLASFLLGSVLLAVTPVQAASCVEGLVMLEKTLRKLELADEEFDLVTDLMFKAKIEADRGNAQKCVYIVADIIKLVFLKETQ